MIGIDGRDFQDPPVAGALAALNDAVIVQLNGRNAASINLKSDATGTMTVTTSVSFDDGLTFDVWPFRWYSATYGWITALSMTASARQNLLMRFPGATHVQVKATSFTAGSVAVRIVAQTLDAAQTGNQEVVGPGVQTGGVVGNPVQVAFESRLTQRAVTGDATISRPIVDKLGRQVITDGAIRELTDNNTVTLLTTTETTLIPAITAVFQDVRDLVIANTSATEVRVDFRDTVAGPVRLSINVRAGQTEYPNLRRLKQTAVNTSWTAQLSVAVTDVRITAISERTV